MRLHHCIAVVVCLAFEEEVGDSFFGGQPSVLACIAVGFLDPVEVIV